MDKLLPGDIVVVGTGEVIPVDGVIAEGMALIDQHALTGESTPAEKGAGDRVFASTLMVAGKIFVEVEKAGSETASAKISQILSDTAGYKLTSQHKGERLADKAVIPTLALASLGMATMGPGGAVAILNSDFGTGIRMAAPWPCSRRSPCPPTRAFSSRTAAPWSFMNEVDTVLFDKTGTLTRERPEVGRIIACDEHEANAILRFAAAAEARFAHPIAKAILHAFNNLGEPLPPIDDSRYHVGYGITVHVEGHTVRVGSKRFMEMEGIAVPEVVIAALEEAHREGSTLVMVGVDDALGGAIELQASVRPEVKAIIEGLRDRGIKHIAIISGDHDAPTRKLAESLGMDRYFAQVLPADKAEFVEKLQKEGRKVCFVGDGINDSIALKKANVSISLRGATSIATDTAQIVFMEEGLSKLCDLRDIARSLDQNVKRSWNLILAPNAFCIFGAFTMGFGVMTSVLTNNVAALAALANGMLPLRRIAEAEALAEASTRTRAPPARPPMKRPSRRPKPSPVDDEPPPGPTAATASTTQAPPAEEPSPPAWQVASDLPGRTRFRHAGLRSDLDLARRVEAQLASAHGVTDWHIRPLTGSLLVHFDRHAITRSQVTQLLERRLQSPDGLPDLDRHPSPISFSLQTARSLSPPPASWPCPRSCPPSAVLLVASNLKVLRQSWRELRQRQLGLPTLFTTIIVGTLASGQFLAASLMSWMMAFWRYRHRAAQFRLRRQLLSPLFERRRFGAPAGWRPGSRGANPAPRRRRPHRRRRRRIDPRGRHSTWRAGLGRRKADSRRHRPLLEEGRRAGLRRIHLISKGALCSRYPPTANPPTPHA